MKNFLYSVFCLNVIVFVSCKSGLVTTSNGCYDLIKSSQQQNRNGDYNDALSNFNQVLSKCDAYDAKIPAYAGKAEAQNGLRQFQDALVSANAGLKLDPSNIEILFQKASAEIALGDEAGARRDLNAVTSLTEKNQNTGQRAKIYAKLATLDSRQKNWDDAQANISKAINLDPNIGDIYILQGDVYTAMSNYPAAFTSYDKAVSIQGNASAPAWKAKVESMIKMNQAKYNTSDANGLAAKMTGVEKNDLCSAIQSGRKQGMREMNIDMLQTVICK
jgi:tetratricopeptide (TPR) repeat protein